MTGRLLLGQVELHPVVIPMTVRFRGVIRRRAILIEGPEGWGEFSPFSEYPPEVTARWLASALESACSPLPAPVRRTVPVNVTVPAIPSGAAGTLVAHSGCTTAKVKVAEPGQTEEDDLARVEAVRAALGPTGKIRVDANAGWDVATAIERITRLSAFGLEYVEQPVPTIPEMVKIRESVDVPIAADESVRTASDPLEAAEAGAADIYILKVQPLGGVGRTLALAAEVGLPVVVSSALETSVGMAAGVWAAACLPELSHACGLGTVTMLAEDVVDDRMIPKGGVIDVRRPVPHPELLARHRPDRGECDRMLARVNAAAELLT
ncbi:MAG TPA: o-succinylbenzoate synthase [Acidimicrobiia bacterium]|nr:o-succinylbenzoate synthase [Acidimicrobiia bacterium]